MIMKILTAFPIAVASIVLCSSRCEAAPGPNIGFEVFRLGHMEADRALSLLKALGYTTVEFSAKSKDVVSNTLSTDKIFDIVGDQSADYPWIIKIVNATKTSLLLDDPTIDHKKKTEKQGKGMQGAPKLGGSHLHGSTAGAPEERLLLVYDRNRPEDLERLINLLQTHIDVAAQQIVIEALIIEVNTSDVKELGVEWGLSRGHVSGSFGPPEKNSPAQGTFIFSRDGFTDFNNFSSRLQALQESGKAEVLSSPSVLVLNDRQARIQVGRQIPVAKTTATTSAVTKGVEYFPIGIVLNLRPRINRDRSEVTMQIETIISSISPESAAQLTASGGEISFSPIVDNRLVQTYVRVSDGTPFIIGGLLSTDDQTARHGLPWIGRLPFVGRLFSKERVEHRQREVIVVLTPHVVPLEARSFSYLIPKDSDHFDRFDFDLFRNAYRVRDDEVWDLKFIQESPALLDLMKRVRRQAEADVMLQRREPFKTLLGGNIPGEEVLVRRMMSEIVSNLEYGKEVNLQQVFYFESADGDNLIDGNFGYDVLEDVLDSSSDKATLISFDARSEPASGRYFSYPSASVVRDVGVPTDDAEFASFVRSKNRIDNEKQPLEWTMVLVGEDDIRRLQNIIVLKRLLELNNKLPLTLQSFQPGLQVIFPSREDIADSWHVIDAQVAQLFYESSPNQYYPAFERVFNRKAREVNRHLRSRSGDRLSGPKKNGRSSSTDRRSGGGGR